MVDIAYPPNINRIQSDTIQHKLDFPVTRKMFWLLCLIYVHLLLLVYHSHIHEYAKCSWDVHYTYTYKIGISKFEKHVTTSQFRYETFYYLWVKGFDVRKRDTHSFSSGFFICPSPTRVAPATKFSARKRKANRLVRCLVSTNWLFQNLPKSSVPFWCVTSFALVSPVFHLGLLCHLWVTRPLRTSTGEQPR